LERTRDSSRRSLMLLIGVFTCLLVLFLRDFLDGCWSALFCELRSFHTLFSHSFHCILQNRRRRVYWGIEKAKRAGTNDKRTQYDSNQGGGRSKTTTRLTRPTLLLIGWLEESRIGHATRLGPRLVEIRMTLDGCYSDDGWRLIHDTTLWLSYFGLTTQSRTLGLSTPYSGKCQ